MNEAEIAALVDRLDRLVPREGAHVRLEQYGGGPDESRIVANQASYLMCKDPPVPETFWDRIVPAGCLLVVTAVAALVIIGLRTVMGWLR